MFSFIFSQISERSFARIGSGVAVFGLGRFGSVFALSVLDFVHLGSALALRAFARVGSAMAILDLVHLGSPAMQRYGNLEQKFSKPRLLRIFENTVSRHQAAVRWP